MVVWLTATVTSPSIRSATPNCCQARLCPLWVFVASKALKSGITPSKTRLIRDLGRPLQALLSRPIGESGHGPAHRQCSKAATPAGSIARRGPGGDFIPVQELE